MNKREYAQTNKESLTSKAQEEGVKPLPRVYIIRCWQMARLTVSIICSET
ncbi:MAG: hypothetical protein SOZ58_02730 [Prevotella sp.]|nr:hypothetical protein [Prevotella sp.]